MYSGASHCYTELEVEKFKYPKYIFFYYLQSIMQMFRATKQMIYQSILHYKKVMMMIFNLSVVRELAELHKVNASRASEAEEAALSRETQAREQLSLALEKAQEEARIQQEALANQVTLADALLESA